MRLTIITINLNNRDGLRRTMESVISQSCQDFEYVVIDGGSTDGSREVILEHQEQLAYWCSEPDRGIYHAMNKGVSHATGDYCLFLNSGDYLYNKDVVKEILPELDGRYDIVHGIVRVIELDGTTTYRTGEFRHDTNSIQLINDTICHPASFIKKEWLERYPYDENYRIVSDKKFFLDCYFTHNCSFHYIDKIVSFFLIGGISNTAGPKGLLTDETNNMMSKLFPAKLVKDIKLMDPELLYLWGQIPTSYRLRKALISMMSFIIKSYQFFKKCISSK